jgi:2-keto-3-deoxy-L-rhamnonate aldolase RhmA
MLWQPDDHPANAGAVDTIMARAKAAGIPDCVGITSRLDQQRDLIARGVLVLTVTTDVELLAGGAARSRAAIGD